MGWLKHHHVPCRGHLGAIFEGLGSYLGLDGNGNIVVTSSAAGNGPANSIQFNTAGGVLSGSSSFVYQNGVLHISGSGSNGEALVITGSLLPSGSAAYNLGSADNRWNQIFLSSGSLHLGSHCQISTC